MIASQASIYNKNYTYGEVTYGYPSVTRYGWFNSYPYIENAYYGEYSDKCPRDIARTITPCCQVTLIKN
jgi:hypothetical protein